MTNKELEKEIEKLKAQVEVLMRIVGQQSSVYHVPYSPPPKYLYPQEVIITC